MIWAGIDNGLSGYLSALDDSGKIIESLPMPTVGKTKGNEVDCMAVWEWLLALQEEDHMTVILETPGKFSPGVMSLCSMWDSYGAIRSILETRGIRHHRIPPAQWQKKMIPNCAKGDTKPAALRRVKQLWPSANLLRTGKCSKVSDGLVDSLLIAEFGRISRL